MISEKHSSVYFVFNTPIYLQVTSLVHMPNGKVYDPLIGQWMSPLWENVLDRVDKPTHLHLYRFNGNDPIDVRHTDRPSQPTGKFATISSMN